jgi:HSP20 family protein
MDMWRAMLSQDSLRELENLSRRLNGVLERRGTAPRDNQETMASADWAPVVDVVESESEFVLLAELPGIEKSDVKLTVEAGILTLTGQREQEQAIDGKSARYHRSERAYGRFARSFSVPESVDEQRLSAEFRNGILTVRLPKAEKAKPRSVEVRVS